MSRILPVFLLALFALPAFAQLKIKLEFPGPGERQVWIASDMPKGKLPETTTVDGLSADFEPGAFGPSDKLFVLDARSGNLAVKPLGEVSGAWKLTERDFSRIGALRVRVEHKGLPVESASIAISAGKETQSQIIDSSSAGEAIFYGASPGPIQVTVSYKTTAGDTPAPKKLTEEVPIRRAKPEATIIVPIADEVATANVPQSEEVKRAQEESKQESGGGGGGLGSLISFLLAVGVAALAVFFGLKWMKANQDQVQAKLSKLGVEIPTQGDGGDDAAPATVQAPIAPPPPAQILLDDATPSPISATTPTSGLQEVTDPRLVSSSGDVLPLDEGPLTVGREPGLGLSLINESTVSRNHAEIVRQGTSVRVRDLGSTNGTFVNGVQVTSEVELRPGDQVQFGMVRFRFEG